MNLKQIKLLSIFFLTLLVSYSCSKNEAGTTANVKLKLVDAPGDYQEVNVEIIDIQYSGSEEDTGWKSFSSFAGPVNVDLTTLIAGNNLLLSDEIIETGMLSQIRLILSDNNSILLEGETETRALSAPSAQQSGLKLKLDQTLESGFSYTYILDWDVQKSIVSSGNSGGYNLKPVIRVIAEVNSAIITGVVVADEDKDPATANTLIADAVVSVYTSSDVYVTETLTNNEGKFTVQGIPAGEYKIKIAKEGFVDFESSSLITIVAGEAKDTGELSIIIL